MSFFSIGNFLETSSGRHFGLENQTLTLSDHFSVLHESLIISTQTSKLAQNGFQDFSGFDVPYTGFKSFSFRQ